MVVGERLRGVREKKNLSQGDVEKRTGLLRCYISRVENGHTVPCVDTLEKLARALEVPLYQLFYDGEKPPKIASVAVMKSSNNLWGATGKDSLYLSKLRRLLSKIGEGDRKLVLHMAQKMATSSPNETGPLALVSQHNDLAIIEPQRTSLRTGSHQDVPQQQIHQL